MFDSGLMKLIALPSVIALCAFGPLPTALTAQKFVANRIPFVNPTRVMGEYMLRVPRQGSFDWNGQHIGREELVNYLRQLAAISSVKLLVTFEPKIREGRKAWVQKQVMDSTLCRQHRCGEVGWDQRWPGVN